MKPNKQIFRFASLGIVLSLAVANTLYAQYLAKSPAALTTVRILKNDQNTLTLEGYYHKQKMFVSSIAFQAEKSFFGKNIKKIEQIKDATVSRTFPLFGNNATVHTDKQIYVFQITQEAGYTAFLLEVNVYDNGIAWRIRMPSAGKLLHDWSKLSFAEYKDLWWQGDEVTYEGSYRPASAFPLHNGQKIGMPMTLAFSGNRYLSVMESDLHDYCGTYLQYDSTKKTFAHRLAGNVQPVSDSVITSWRVISLGTNLNTLVNNELVADLAPDPDLAIYPHGLEESWIKPGKSLWSWMSNNRSIVPSNMQKFTDNAAALGIPYNLIDDGWAYWKQDGKDNWALLQEQADHAKSKGVGIWVWKAYPDGNGVKGLKDSAYMDAFFKRCHDIGVKGLKIDFFNSEQQPEIAFYERAAKVAARYHLMIDYHGADKATGLEKTYPNVLTQEGVRGLEQMEHDIWPLHNCILPFTRYLSGPADFTPMSFRSFVKTTTLAHQAATTVVFTSPFLCLGVDPDDLLKSPVLPIVKDVPSTWDETKVLPQSQIGVLVVMAKRKGTTWYLAAMNGLQEKDISIPLRFLGKGDYTFSNIQDGKGGEPEKITTDKKATSSETLKIHLRKGGGFLGKFVL
ncbi:MAG: glycoside hydrolase family 97 catalytic domain-containing protein [Chitinophagaceae bacterium]